MALGEGLGVDFGVGLGVSSGVGSGVGLGVSSGVGAGEAVSSGVGEGVSEGDAVSVGDSSGLGLGDGFGVGVGVGVAVADGFGVGVGVRVPVGRGVADFFALGDPSGRGEGVGVRFLEAEDEDELFDFFLGGGVLVKKSFTLPNTPSCACASRAGPAASATTMKNGKSLFMRHGRFITRPAPAALLYSCEFPLPDFQSGNSR